jgi:hypothetical protein
MKRIVALLHPSSWKPTIDVARLLWFEYAHLKSVVTKSCVDRAGLPVPWYTYPAIEYLKQLDFSDKAVFEYGSGNSTLFWASRAKRVVSVEDDPLWLAAMRPRLLPHCEITLETDLAAYPSVIARTGERFDVIVVDGAARARTRLKCAQQALQHLAPGGMIILDNSDWLPESTRLLREAELIQVDMTGFAPISGVTQSTSIFLHRAFAFRPAGARQPMPGPGAADKVWEHPDPTEQPLVRCGNDVFGGVRRDDPVHFHTTGGERAFRFIVSDSRESGRRFAALLDVERDRVLLALPERLEATPRVEAELERIVALPWDEFVAVINRHGKRRYDLEVA